MGSMLKWFLIVVLVAGGIGALFGGGGDSDTPKDHPSGSSSKPDRASIVGDAIGAQVVCQQFVEDRLKSPSTADFSDEDARHVHGKRWQVIGSVDSENGFGAMIRNDYRCLVTFKGDDNWRLIELSGLDS